MVASSSSVALASATATLQITFTPSTTGGNYSPKNLWAVWITNSSGTWVRNMDAKTSRSNTSHLTRWRQAYTATVATGVDGVSGATASSFTPFSKTWDLTNGKTTAKLPLGRYTIGMQFADGDNMTTQNPAASVAITLGSTPIDTTVPSATFPYHKSIHLVYTP